MLSIIFEKIPIKSIKYSILNITQKKLKEIILELNMLDENSIIFLKLFFFYSCIWQILLHLYYN